MKIAINSQGDDSQQLDTPAKNHIPDQLIAANLEMVTAIVARARTVYTGVEKYPVWDGEKKAMITAFRPCNPVGPGGAVTLPRAEVERLQAIGFLVKAGVDPLPTGNGPTYGRASITEGA